MKIYVIAISLLLSVITDAQVNTMSRLPAGNNNNNANMQAVQTVIQTPASLYVSVLTCNDQNLADDYEPVTNFIPGKKYFSAVILDNPFTNNNPAAVIIVVPIRTEPLPFSIYYDKAIGKWKIKIEHNGSDDRDRLTGIAGPSDLNLRGYKQVEMLPYSPKTLQPGDKFNILINQ
jgi:hypothetical protein